MRKIFLLLVARICWYGLLMIGWGIFYFSNMPHWLFWTIYGWLCLCSELLPWDDLWDDRGNYFGNDGIDYPIMRLEAAK